MGGRGRKTTAIGTSLGSVLVVLLLVASGSAGAAVALPDGRAWEMVSPLEKNGGEINGINGTVPNEGLPEGGIVQAASNGDAVTYLSLLAFPDSNGDQPKGAPIASQYLSAHEADRWATEDITIATNSKVYPDAGSGAPYQAFSTNLSRGLMSNGSPPPVESPPLGGAPPRYVNYYLRDNYSGSFEALMTQTPSEEPSTFFMEFVGATSDLAHVLIATSAALPPVTTPQSEGNLYEWTDGQFQPINVLPPEGKPGHPSETVSGGARLGMRRDESHTVSDDGSRVFWSRPGNETLLVRKNIGTEQAATTQIDASQGGSDPGGLGEFRTASWNGSKAFFTDRRRLTPDSTAGGDRSHEDLYLFDVEHNRLTDLTVDNSDPGGAAVRGVLEASSDGSYVYFVAEGALPGTGAVLGNDNLYMWHEGVIKLVAVLSSNDNGHGGFREPGVAHDWDFSTSDRTARVTADGRRLLFMSSANLTGYDSQDANTPSKSDEEIYLYDAPTGNLTCVSCNPSGARPIGSSGFPGGTPLRTSDELGTYQAHVLTADGSTVFFDSKDALVPQDTNGAQDVYEWEQDGTSDCRQVSGCVYLLSGATSTSESAFVDASTNGDDVFFVTRAQLVSQDTDQLRDLYDARAPHVPGETVAFSSPSSTYPCEGENCLPLITNEPESGAVGSETFSGFGNLVTSPASKAKMSKPTKMSKSTKKNAKHKKHRKKARKAARSKATHKAAKGKANYVLRGSTRS